MQDRKWLTKNNGETWHVQCFVPRDLVAKIGKKKLIQTLHTRDFREAQARRLPVMTRWLALFARLREPAGEQAARASTSPPATPLPRMARAPDGTLTQDDSGADWLADALHWRLAAPDPLTDGVIAGQADDLEISHGPTIAAAFAGVAFRTQTPLPTYVEHWLAEGGPKGRLAERTVAQYRADFDRFATWAARHGASTIEGVTRKLAGQYVAEELVAKRIGWATANRILTAPASYWKWLIKRGHAEASPWTGQSLAKDAREKKPRRALTRAELATLLQADPEPDMRDLIRVGALAGMRLGEIVGLRVRDCVDGWFVIHQGKTAAAARRVPIHSELAPLVARLAGKAPDAHLLPWKGDADSASKRFARFRVRAGVDVRDAPQKRQSEVTFHSLRHFFTTEARNAGIDRYLVDVVTGHVSAGETDGRYHGGPTEQLLRACVEAVRL